MADTKYPTEIINLPSEGKCYPKENPLSSGTVELKYMTAKEEEILASQNLIKKGVALDKLFESIIVNKDVNPDDIILGDKNAIMLATRILGYGADYKVKIANSYGDKDEITIDLSKIETRDIDTDKLSPENEYEFTTPSGAELKFRLLTHGDEKKIDADVKAMSRLNKGGASPELTTRYRYMITEVDGDASTKAIQEFINYKFVTRDTRAFREYLREIAPDVEMEFTYEDPQTGEEEVRPIPMGVNFFWPST